MTVWSDCKMTTFFYSGQEAHVDFPCVVKLQKGKILVEYQDGGYVQYEGKEMGSGHYVLNLLERDGKASLHMFEESSILEGSWVEGGYRGMWKISLQ